MRKAIKIKTSLMLLAWSVIFLHGIIPHNHLEQRDAGCSHICHQGTQEKDDSEIAIQSNLLLRNIVYDNEQNEMICHFASELIHQNDIDKVFINETGNFKLTPVLTGKQCIIRTSPGSIIKAAYSLMPLRAPPMA
ncbi:MAG: hypothetical protein RQ743_09705 [Bacteroidales bacterium]|nr:hypothetical protein [Bacteroidales bacterium]